MFEDTNLGFEDILTIVFIPQGCEWIAPFVNLIVHSPGDLHGDNLHGKPQKSPTQGKS